MTNKRIINVLVIILLLFLSLIGYLTYFEIVLKDKVSQNPFNQRQWAYEEDTVRGRILDKNGVVLAKSDDKTRVYPYKNLYSHIIGYNSKTYGKSLLEAKYNKELLGQDNFSQAFNLAGGKRAGYDITLTIDHNIQKLASDRLGKNNGSVVALNPKTGEVLALVSKPDFDPSADALAENWKTLTDSEQSPLLPRATSGLYAPGSTFKILTAASAIEQQLNNEEYTDYGKVTIGGKIFENQKSKAYGKIDMERGFEVSSNVVFCTLGAKIGSVGLAEIAERFGFNKTFGFDLPMSKSRFPTVKADEAMSAALGMGQGDTLATPLQMAMITSAIANNGNMMRPFLVYNIKSSNGFPVMENKPQLLYKPIVPDVALEIKDMMIKTVKKGTGTAAAIKDIQVAGKTGTAENEVSIKQKNKEHTWFVAFAPAHDPEIAVAVMMEFSGGSGGGNCAPIARDIISEYLRK